MHKQKCKYLVDGRDEKKKKIQFNELKLTLLSWSLFDICGGAGVIETELLTWFNFEALSNKLICYMEKKNMRKIKISFLLSGYASLSAENRKKKQWTIP